MYLLRLDRRGPFVVFQQDSCGGGNTAGGCPLPFNEGALLVIRFPLVPFRRGEELLRLSGGETFPGGAD